MASSSSGGGGGGGVPPGFRFHPTDEELLHFYLKKKVSFQKFDMEVIREVDLNKIEPWELQERCKIGSTPQNEWYFFSHKDRKYPTGSRTNRATGAGFWKATGRDKCIRNSLKKIGMRKTLVFYRGRAPHGQKTDWIMHEYRLDDDDDMTHDPTATTAEDGWVVCRVFKKKNLFKVGNSNGNSSSGMSMMVMMNNVNTSHAYDDGDDADLNMSTSSISIAAAATESRSLFTHRNSCSNNIDNINHSTPSPYLLHSHDQNISYTDHNNTIIPLLPPYHQYPQQQLESQNFIVNKPLMLSSSTHHHNFGIATTTTTSPSNTINAGNYDNGSSNCMQVKQFIREDCCESAISPAGNYQAPQPAILECNKQPTSDDHPNFNECLIEINAPTTRHHHQESNSTNSSSINQNNPLSLRNETDFWAYAK